MTLDSVAAYARATLERAGAAPAQGAETILVRLPELVVRVRSFDAGLAEAVRRNLLQAPGTASPDQGEMTIAILHGAVPGGPDVAGWAPSAPYVPHHVAEALRREGLRGAYFHDLGHWHLLDPERGRGVQLYQRPGGFPPWETGAPLRPFLHWHYAHRGLRLAHAGTLGVDGAGVLLAGAGGSGKSGTVIAGLLHGLQTVGDDYVLLDTREAVTARPLFATLKQDPAGFARLRLARHLPEPGPLNWQGKAQFRIQDLVSDPVPEALTIRALLVPRVGASDRTRILPMPRSEAMMAVASSSLYQMPGESESGFRFFADMTRRLPCFRVALGPDPAEIAGCIGEFIGRGGA